MSVFDEIKKLDEQKAALLSEAKHEAMQRALQAIRDLKELGFDYSLTEGSDAAALFTNKRRTGIKQEVLTIVSKEGGATRANVIEAMNAKGDKSLTGSISNALANLKKDGTISLADGTYTAK